MLKENLKNFREQKQLSKTELAKKSNLSVRTIQLIENGKLKNQKISTLNSLANALDISVENLIK